MTISVRIPGPLRPFCDGQSRLVVEGATTVAAAIGALPAGVRERILDEQGRVRQHVNVFVGDSDIHETGGLATPLRDGASVFVIPAVSGGARVASRARRSRAARSSSAPTTTWPAPAPRAEPPTQPAAAAAASAGSR